MLAPVLSLCALILVMTDVNSQHEFTVHISINNATLQASSNVKISEYFQQLNKIMLDIMCIYREGPLIILYFLIITFEFNFTNIILS